MPTYIHTLGDSSLDNFKWMLNAEGTNRKQAKRKSVEGQLESTLNSQTPDGRRYKVISHAYDGFTTKSLLYGDTVGAVLPESASKTTYLREKAPGASRFVHPLSKLETAITEHPDAHHYVVLSCGGNDFRENLSTPWRLLSEIPGAQARYIQIVEKIQELQRKNSNIRPILMFQYRTDAKNDPYGIYTILGTISKITAVAEFFSIAKITSFVTGAVRQVKVALGCAVPETVANTAEPNANTNTSSGVAMIGSLMGKFYQPILKRAREDKIPILDLPNTFNPYARLYTAGIEPNKAGGALIAEGLAHIITKHDFTSHSRLYAKTAQDATYTETINSETTEWKVRDR